jgi:chemotaxis protein MotB
VNPASSTKVGPSPRRARRARGGRQEESEENQERWLLTYSDMITLLLVLFIVLFALSQIDQAKFREFKQSVTSAELTRTPKGTTKVPTKLAAKAAPISRLQQIKRELSSALNSQGLLGDVTLTINASGLVEGLVADTTFFATNSAQLSAVGDVIVDTSAAVLKKYPNAIEVAGYTDDEPITGGPYANNWELSAARATTVVIRMTTSDSVNSGQVVVLGYGQYHPLVPNTSLAGQAQNRRVNIVISPTSKFMQ